MLNLVAQGTVAECLELRMANKNINLAPCSREVYVVVSIKSGRNYEWKV